MKTISVGVQNNCAPCGCACRYCLLCSDKRAGDGVDYWRGRKVAERILEWGREQELSAPPYYSIGYCAEYPELLDTIAFNRAAGFVGARFLQSNGIAMRADAQLDDFLRRLRDAGVQSMDATFFGTEAYHDHFAAREGDFRFMLRLAEAAQRQNIVCQPTVPLTAENLPALDELLKTLGQVTDLRNLHTFLPDYRGRGRLMENVRLTPEQLALLPEEAMRGLNRNRYRTERDWLTGGPLPEFTRRQVIINVRRDNIDMLENMSAGQIVRWVEELDDTYYRAIPKINELAKLYGDDENTRLYQLRDLCWKWGRRYIAEHGLRLHDITDERLCATVRS